MGFEELDSAINQPPMSLTAQDAAFCDESLSDEAALSIVLQDAQSAKAYLDSKQLVMSLDMADDLYRSVVKSRPWPGTDVPRSNLGMPVILEAIEKIMPACMGALFGSRGNPFILEPRGNTTRDAAKAKEHVLAWAVDISGFRAEIQRSLKSALLYGLTVGAWGWKTQEVASKHYNVNGDKVDRQVKRSTVSFPFYECLDLRKILVDPGCNTQDVRRSARFVIKQFYITAEELDDLREDETYKNVPTRDELRNILAAKEEPATDSMPGMQSNIYRELQAAPPQEPQSVDPLAQPLELLEYWTKDRVITVLQRKVVVRNEENEFERLPNVSCAFIDVLNSLWGFGVARLLSGEQRFQQGVVNTWIDALALTLNPTFQEIKGMAQGAQQIKISPGKVLTTIGELKPLVVPSISAEAQSAIENSEARAARRVGANGGSGMPSQALRTAEGIQSFTGDVVQRLQYFLETFIDLVFVPVLESFLELCNDHLDPATINKIISDRDGKAYQGEIADVYNAQCDVKVLAGTKLSMKIAAAQLAPMIMTMVSQQPTQDSLTQQGMKFDFAAFAEDITSVLGWEIDQWFVPMTPEDRQRAQQNAQAMKMQQQMMLQQQKHQNDLENIDQKGVAQAGVAVVRTILKNHEQEAAQALESSQEMPSGVAG